MQIEFSENACCFHFVPLFTNIVRGRRKYYAKWKWKGKKIKIFQKSNENELTKASVWYIIMFVKCGRGGTGRRARLRILWVTPCRFNSCRPHQIGGFLRKILEKLPFFCLYFLYYTPFCPILSTVWGTIWGTFFISLHFICQSGPNSFAIS